MKQTLLLLPGMLCDRTFWSAQADAIDDLATPIFAAYGDADTIAGMARHVLRMAPPAFALAGHSLGGRVALEIVKQAPKRVQRLALIATDYRGHQSAAARAKETKERRQMLADARDKGMEGMVRDWFTAQIAPAQTTNVALINTMTAMGTRHSIAQLEAEIEAGLNREDYSALLPTIACPTLICAGAMDRLRPVARHTEMAARIPNARLIVIEGSGHMVAMENPEALTAVLRAWLSWPKQAPESTEGD